MRCLWGVEGLQAWLHSLRQGFSHLAFGIATVPLERLRDKQRRCRAHALNSNVSQWHPPPPIFPTAQPPAPLPSHSINAPLASSLPRSQLQAQIEQLEEEVEAQRRLGMQQAQQLDSERAERLADSQRSAQDHAQQVGQR